MKKIISTIMIFALILTLFISADASVIKRKPSSNLEIAINGRTVCFDQESGYPIIDSNDRTLVPIRAAMESAGASVRWNSENSTAEILKDGVTLYIKIGSTYLTDSLGNITKMDTQSVLINDRTYIPLRFACQALDMTVKWFWDSNQIIILDKSYDKLYTDLMNSFDYSDANLNQVTNTVTVTALATDNTGCENFASYWTGIDEYAKSFLIELIAKEKQQLNIDYDISIVFVFKDLKNNESYYLGTVNSYNFDTTLINPFVTVEINPLQ